MEFKKFKISQKQRKHIFLSSPTLLCILLPTWVFVWCVFIHIHTCTHAQYRHVHRHTCTQKHTHTHTCTVVHGDTQHNTHVRTCIRMYTQHSYTHSEIHSTHMHTYTYIPKYTTYTNTQHPTHAYTIHTWPLELCFSFVSSSFIEI